MSVSECARRAWLTDEAALVQVYHPNIDFDGAVCLNILRAEWKPVLDINAVIYGIIFLFYEPNPEDPLNKEAAVMLRVKPNL